MGHSAPGVTLREYGHLFEGTQAKLTEQLDGLVQSTRSAPPPAQIIDFSEDRAAGS